MPFDFAKGIDAGNTAWLLASSALVLIMTPGLAFFYGGMVRAKNVLAMLMQNFVCIAIVSVIWTALSYSIAFGGENRFWGGVHFAGLSHITEQVPGYTGALVQTTPPLVFIAFQLMFAIITPALFTGSTADRWRFGPFVLFVALWSILVYAPIAHWVFSPAGWLFQRGAEDFAGGTVVHANAGAAGLALALVLGKRRGWPGGNFKPHNVPFVLLGAALLWFGWFGFNAGSALGATQAAAVAFYNTQIATATAMLGWIVVEKLRDGKSTTLGAASGAVAGLVAITPACAFLKPVGALALGFIAGAVCALATAIKGKVGIDDSLDVVAVHLVGGVLGALLIGFLGTASVAGRDGLFYGGGAGLLGEQALAVASAVGWSFVVTLILAFIINAVWKMRVTEDEELEGLDLAVHGESAYEFVSFNGSGGGTPSQRPAPVPEEAKA
jgi:Amt family ammonium transporter